MSRSLPDSAAGGPLPGVGAIIVAAGDSRRMGGMDKMLVPLMGRPLFTYSVRAFNDCPLVGAIVLVMSPLNVAEGRRLVKENGWHKVRDVCTGGERRQDSVRSGLDRLRDTDWAIVHDGARPCVDGGTIARGLREAREHGAAVAAVPVRDTIKSARPDMVIVRTVPRDGLWAVQTPQVFRTDLLRQAHRQVSEDVTDDASMVEQMGGTVRVFMGSYENIKVTTPEDIPIAEAILMTRAAKGRGTSQ